MISVCMATYNGAKYLREQVDSILLQLSCDDELIVSDDASIDDTINILKSYNDPRIKIFTHIKTPQMFKYNYTTLNFENALTKAHGDIIFFSDQDDVWIDGKVTKMLSMLEHNDLVLSDCSFVDANLDILVQSKFQFEGVKIGFLHNLYRCGYLGSSMAFRRNLLEFILPFPQNVPHDMWLGFIGNSVGRFNLLREQTMLYRRHDQNVSSTNNNLLNKQKLNNSIKLNRNTNSLKYKMHYRLIIVQSYCSFLVSYKIKKMKEYFCNKKHIQ